MHPIDPRKQGVGQVTEQYSIQKISTNTFSYKTFPKNKIHYNKLKCVHNYVINSCLSISDYI